MTEARTFRVVGRVQGVGFRWYTRDVARRDALVGWVRNEADGSVEVFAEGARDALDRLEAHLRFGPGGARVDCVDVVPQTPSGQYSDFSIKG